MMSALLGLFAILSKRRSSSAPLKIRMAAALSLLRSTLASTSPVCAMTKADVDAAIAVIDRRRLRLWDTRAFIRSDGFQS